MDAVTVDDERADEAAQLEQVVPIASIARETRSFEAEDGADGSLADAADEIPETGAIHRAARRAAEICVDHGDVAKAVARARSTSPYCRRWLSRFSCTWRSRRLADVDNGAAFQRLLRKLTKRHR